MIDTDTGEIFHPRSDPDAVAFHPGDNACGRMLVSAIARNPHPNERIVLDLDFKPASGKSDATVFTDMTLQLAQRAHIAGAVYDMALYPADCDRLLTAGLLPISKVQRTSNGGAARVNLGEHTFHRSDDTTVEVVITAVDGAPTITIPSSDGPAVISLVRQQTKRRRNADGTYTVYGIWLVPHHPAVDKRLRGAKVTVRENSTPDEIQRGEPRTRAKRPIPENDLDFPGLFGLREDVESMHHDFKRTLVNDRARCVGLRRQRINHHAYQLHTVITALLAWHYRTGGDLDHWFGHWRPPPRRSPAAA